MKSIDSLTLHLHVPSRVMGKATLPMTLNPPMARSTPRLGKCKPHYYRITVHTGCGLAFLGQPSHSEEQMCSRGCSCSTQCIRATAFLGQRANRPASSTEPRSNTSRRLCCPSESHHCLDSETDRCSRCRNRPHAARCSRCRNRPHAARVALPCPPCSARLDRGKSNDSEWLASRASRPSP